MSTTKNQHYVPQSYLLRFAKNEQVWVYDKFDKRKFSTIVRNVASESYFYDIPKEVIPDGMNIDRQVLEKSYARMEGAFNIEVDRLISRIENYRPIDRLVDRLLNVPLIQLLIVHFNSRAIRRGRLTEGQRQALAFYMAQQILRTREYRNWISNIHDETRKTIAHLFDEPYDEPSSNETQKTWNHIQHLADPKSAQPIYECLSKDIWAVGVNVSEQPLYTSDNPVVKQAHLDESRESFSGWCSPGIEIAYPLTSRYVLILWDGNVYDKLRNRDGRLFALTSDNVTYLNSLQVMQSYRQVYCSAPTFDLVEQVCIEHPNLCSPDRYKIQVNHG